jgi:hypothetical protein
VPGSRLPLEDPGGEPAITADIPGAERVVIMKLPPGRSAAGLLAAPAQVAATRAGGITGGPPVLPVYQASRRLPAAR